MYTKDFRVHFVGIGGVGMAGIAEVLLNLGYAVSGSDVKPNALIERLQELGATITIGHASALISKEIDTVVFSSAVRAENPELTEAAKLGIPVIPRAEMLAELMRMKYGIAVAGSHGKTTTTSMIGHILENSELDPTVIIGGRVLSERTGASLGTGQYLVAEADESDGSFKLLRPAISIVTNIDVEHLGHYGSFGALEQAFHDFLTAVPFYGLVIACVDDPVVAKMLPGLKRRVVTFGLSPQADISAQNVVVEGGISQFTVFIKSDEAGRFSLPMPGSHLVSNSLAAIAVALELGIPRDKIALALAQFPGVARRSEVLVKGPRCTVIDDYGHHPTEIISTLRAIRLGWIREGVGRLIVVFQPHRYSRTKELFSEFVSAFGDADELILTDIYSAGEDPVPGVSGELLAQSVQHHAVTYLPHVEEISEEVFKRAREGDVVVTLGAGNISSVAQELKSRLT